MPTALTAHLTTWLDLAVELSRHAGPVFPRVAIADQLAETFGCLVSWNWLDDDGSFGFELREPVPGFPAPGEGELWAREGMRIHPLLRWYATTADPAPMTVARVPRQVAPARGFALVQELLSPYDLDQQLSIPHRLSRASHRTFVLARGRDDFTEAEVELARRIQPLVALVDRQVATLEGTRPARNNVADLTQRELAVLRLLADGLTANAIGHRLLVSPRTVHTHLGSVYRKLGVADRMRAVLVARDLCLLSTPGADDADRVMPGLDHGCPGARWSGVSPHSLLGP